MKVFIFRISSFLVAVLLLLQLAEAHSWPQDNYDDNSEAPPRKHKHKNQPFEEVKGVIEIIKLTLTIPLTTHAAAATICIGKDCKGDKGGNGGEYGKHGKDGNRNGKQQPPKLPLTNSTSTALSFTYSTIATSAVSVDNLPPPSEPTTPQFTLPPTPLTTTISALTQPTFVMSAAPPNNTPNNTAAQPNDCVCQCLCAAGVFPDMPPAPPIAQLPPPQSAGPSPSPASPPPPTTLTSVSSFASAASTDGSTSAAPTSSVDDSTTDTNSLPTTSLPTDSLPTDSLPTNESAISAQPTTPIASPTALSIVNGPQGGPPPPAPFGIDTLSLTSQLTFKIGQRPSTATVEVGGP